MEVRMKKGLNSFQLKCICIGMMIIGMAMQTACSLYELVHPGQATEWMYTVFYIGQVVYLAAFPLSAFLLVEAFRHTSDRKKLLLRLFTAAVLVELPMDVAYNARQVIWWGQNQNYFFTLVIGLLVLLAVEAIVKKAGQGTLKANLLTLVVYLAATMAAILLRTEQSSVGVLTIIALYLFYGNRMFSFVTVAAIYLFFTGSTGKNVGLEYLPVLGMLFLWLYNGEQGRANKMTRAVFYFAFPITYCLMRSIAHLIA